MQGELPFTVRTQLADRRGSVHFIAERDGEELAIARYSVGDFAKRDAIARKWAAEKVLSNGRLLSQSAISRALQQAELAALPVIESELSAEETDDVVGIPCASYVDDDRIIELAWNLGEGRPDFIIYDRHSQKTDRKPTVEVGDSALCPPRCAKGICTPGGCVPGTVFLPTQFDEAGLDEDKLRDDIRVFVRRYVDLPSGAEALVIEYILLTWLHDAFDEVPYLAYRTADIGRGKSRALETNGVVCYRPILCGGGSTAAATLRLLDTFGGTLVADEYDQRDTELAAELTKIINQGFQKNRPLVRCTGEDNEPHPFRCFGPKLFALRKGFADDATESRIISIRMRQRIRDDVPISLPRAQFDRQALALRNRLLAWRFANLGRVAVNPEQADPRLEDRLNQIGLPLMAVAGDEGRHIVVEALLEQQTTLAADRGDSLPGEILLTVLRLAKPGGSVRPRDVAKALNSQRAEVQGVDLDKLPKDDRLSPNKAGWALKSVLELPRVRDRTGSSYKLDKARIGQLCERYGVPPGSLSPLPHCHVPQTLPPENPLFDAENGGRGNGGNGGNVADAPGRGNVNCHTETRTDKSDTEDVPF